MNLKRLSIISVTVAFLATALVITPVATAQGQLDAACGNVAVPSLTVTPKAGNNNPIRPVTDTGQVQFDVVYEVNQGGGASVTPVTLNFEASTSDPGFTTLTWAPASLDIQVANNGPTKKEQTVTVSVAFDRSAPAFKTSTISLTVSGTGGTCVVPPTEKTERSQVKVGFYEQVQAAFTSQIFKASQNSQVSIPMKIENFGNGAVQMRFQINADLTSKELSLPVPAPVIVPSTAQGGETNKAEFTVDVKTPFKNGYQNRQDSVTLDISGTSSDDTSVAIQPLQVSAVIQTQGVYVPGFGAATLFAALGMLAFAGRRRL